MDIDTSEKQNDTTEADAVSLEHPGLDYQFNVLLINIGREITDDDLTIMKYLLRGDQGTGKGVLEKITTPLKLFDHLRSRCLLSRDNILFLQAMLYHARLMDLYKKTIEFAKDRGNILHCYPESDKPVNGYKYVTFHVEGAVKRHTVEEIRSRASYYLNVPSYFVTVQGIRATQSFLIIFMVPEECYNCLYKLGEAEKQSLKSIGVDYIVVDEEIVELTESSSKEVSPQGLQLNEELNYYFKQNAALQKQLEQHQLRELRPCKPETASIGIMSSLTIIATLLFNILQEGKSTILKQNTSDSAYKYFEHTMNKIKNLGYDKDLIGSLLEAHILVIRNNFIDKQRLLLEQQKWHINFLEHMYRKARYTQDKLKYMLGKGLTDSVLSENEEYFLRYLMTNDTPNQINIQTNVHVIIGDSGDITQLRPYLKELSSNLNDKDMQKLKQKFGIKSADEKVMQQQNLSFIELLMTVDARSSGGVLNIESFGNKFLSIVNREDFKTKWKSQMKKFDLKRQQQQRKTGTQSRSKSKIRTKSETRKVDKSDEVTKIEEVSDKLEVIMRRMSHIENLVQNPFARLEMAKYDSFVSDFDEMQNQFKGTR